MRFITLIIWISGVASFLFARASCALDYDVLRLRELLNELTERYPFPNELDEAGQLGERQFFVREESACNVFITFHCEATPIFNLERYPMRAFPNKNFDAGLRLKDGALKLCQGRNLHKMNEQESKDQLDALVYEVTAPGEGGGITKCHRNQVMSKCGVVEGSTISLTMNIFSPTELKEDETLSSLEDLEHLKTFAYPPPR